MPQGFKTFYDQLFVYFQAAEYFYFEAVAQACFQAALKGQTLLHHERGLSVSAGA